jgi:thioredoxin 2
MVTCPCCGRRNRIPTAASGAPRCAGCGAPLPWLTSAGDADFGEVVIESSLPVLLDLSAPWCGPCRTAWPGVEQAAHAFAGRLKAVVVNVDEAVSVAARFRAHSIPTLLLLRAGQVQVRQVGAVPADALLHWVGSALDQPPPG